jgi:hypothetical protein
MKLALLATLLFSTHLLASTGGESSQWSMRYLARASNFLLVASDAALEKKPLMCGLKKEEPQELILKLKYQIEQKIQRLTTAQKEKIYRWALNCEKDCSCDIFSLALEKDSDSRGGKFLELVNSKGSHTTPAERKACARKFKEFCSSQLLKELRRP